MHVASESHVRQMLIVGENSSKYISDYSNQFQSDFLQLLRTAHGEKKVNLNHFYQEYIKKKDHVHMIATRWTSLTEFGKYLGRESICRVEEGDKGLEVAWIDNSPEALRRQDAIRKKERQDKGDEEREQKLIAEQVERARLDAEAKGHQEEDDEPRALQRDEGEKIKLDFGPRTAPAGSTQIPVAAPSENRSEPRAESKQLDAPFPSDTLSSDVKAPASGRVGLNFGDTAPKNVFGQKSRRNPLQAAKTVSRAVSAKPMSEVERIMKAEIEHKRARSDASANPPASKRTKV
ncbi:MAG: hypothetical protein MMC23_009629 [Stictis urceolatum]|nr:hypothetical protein [Stictis urceolata]